MSRGSVEPWAHRFVSANGARFHVAEVGDGPLVLFLHGFPEFWWAWRHQLSVVADAGYRAAALDLRGYGDSDKTPRGYDPLTQAADVSGVIRSLGRRNAVLVGNGWGGYAAWTAAACHPAEVAALCAVCAPHPAVVLRPPFGTLTWAALAHVLQTQVPWMAERRITHGDYIRRHLTAWSAPESAFPSPSEVARYHEALSRWPSPHCALEYHRWLLRSRMRADGRVYAAAMRRRVDVPVLQITGLADPAVRPSTVEASRRYVTGPMGSLVVSGAGHFPHEETPAAFNDALLAWLSDSARSGADGVA